MQEGALNFCIVSQGEKKGEKITNTHRNMNLTVFEKKRQQIHVAGLLPECPTSCLVVRYVNELMNSGNENC